jgi:hypothetical protein
MTSTVTTPLATAAVVEETTRLLVEHYVFPEIGERVAEVVRRRLAEGAYDGAGPERLAELVTADLQSVNGDRHLRLIHHAEVAPDGEGAAALAVMRREFDRSLGGAPRVELLDGRVAVLELAPLLFPLEWSAEPLSAALSLVAPADALLLDLRGNRGGDPETVAFVCDHLFDGRTHLNTMHWRADDAVEQFWTRSHVSGARFGQSKPLYVLTSARTFSGAEELAYNLQQLGRAVVIGEVTGGGAHPREGWTVHPHLEASIPVGRAVNPVSGTNWEGVGVQPDILCPAPEALARAHELARERLTD